MKTIRPFFIFLSFFSFVILASQLKNEAAPTGQAINGSDGQLSDADSLLNRLEYANALFKYRAVLPVAERQNDPLLLSRLRNSIIECLWRLEIQDEAEQTGMTNLKLCLSKFGWNHEQTAKTLLNLGAVCFLSGRMNLCFTYFEKSLDIYRQLFGERDSHTAEALQWLGTTHESISDTALAHQYLLQSLKAWESVRGDNDPGLGHIYRYLGLYYKRFAILDSAMMCFKKARSLFDRKYGPGNWLSMKCDYNMCDILEYHGRDGEAMDLYNKSLSIIESGRHVYRPVCNSTYLNLAEHYSRKDLTKALYYVQKAIHLYDSTIVVSDVFNNPSKDHVLKKFTSTLAFFYKARFLKWYYEKDPDKDFRYLKTAYECYQFASMMIDEWRTKIFSLDDLLTFENINSNLYAEMADNAMVMYRMTGDTAYVTVALQYLQDNRNWLSLSSDINSLDPPGSMPESARKEWIEKNKLVRYLRDKLDPGSIHQRKDNRMRLNEVYIELQVLNFDHFNDPRQWENAVRMKQAVSLGQVRKMMKQGSKLLLFYEECPDYLAVPNAVLELLITAERIEYQRHDGGQMYNLAKQFTEGIVHRSGKPMVDSLGQVLYERLFGLFPGLAYGGDMVIIPSQHLSALPFDALYTGRTDKEGKRYLINDCAVWKSYSIPDFTKISSFHATPSNDILFVAPVFSKWNESPGISGYKDLHLSELEYPEEEISTISEVYDIKHMVGRRASERSFKKRCAGYPVIHISTHGLPTPSYPEMVRLVFTKGGSAKEDGMLGFHEILSLPLQSDLVVLDACYSGRGEASKGYGNLNLSWAFHQAGSHSEVISQWDANVYSSTKVMTLFYHYLSLGMTKPKALRQAKLAFISSSDFPFRHPYFWAGYEYFGNDEMSSIPAKVKSGLSHMFIGAFLGGGMLFSAFLYIFNSCRRRRYL